MSSRSDAPRQPRRPPARPAAPRRQGAGPRPRAFTLIELLVSLALLALVLSLIYGAFSQISGSALQLRDELNERQELRLLVRMISDDLQAAQWLENAAQKTAPIRTGIVAEREFVGGEEYTRLDMHTARPTRFYRMVDPAADPRLHEVGYRVRLAEDRERLELVRREDFYVDEDLDEGGLIVVLTDNVETFTVEFLAPEADPNALETPWEERWDAPNRADGQGRMPVAVRLTVARKTAAGESLSETVEFNLAGSLKL